MGNNPADEADKDNALSDDELDLVVGGVGSAVPGASVGRETTLKVGLSTGREEQKKTSILTPDIKINQP